MEDEAIKVLLIEDNPDDAKLIRRKLVRSVNSQFTVTPVRRLDDGLEYLAQNVPDLILSDLGLPDSHGLDTVTKILCEAPQTPVVVLSGFDDEATAIKAVQSGAQDYLVKGQMDGNQVERALFYAIERSRLRRELEQYAQEIWKIQANLLKILEKNADAIIVADKDKHILFANPAAESLLEHKKKDLLNKPFGFPLKGGKTSEIEIIQQSGETTIAEMRVADIDWESKPAYLASLRDITERKETEEKLRQIDRIKSEFLSNVSHELRTPLQSISGFTKLILDGKVSDPKTQQEFLQIIDSESQHLGNLINSLLDLSRLEFGRFQINKQLLPIRDTIVNSIKSFHSLARDKDVALSEYIPPKLPEIEVDGERLRQVVINLLSNAIKFSDPGGSVKVKAESHNGELLFQVTDQGIGIPEEAMQHLFERFYRAEDKLARGGTGLGLYISKQIIEAHGGHIWAESKTGEGSTFSFTLPLNGEGGDGHG
jgi:signal transduction histidine kinase/DNA-binding NarL/FixJ family response regulator